MGVFGSRGLAVVVAGAALALTAGCSSQADTASTVSPSVPTAGTATAAAQPCGTAAKAPKWEHVVWIVMENHGIDQTIGSPEAPYFNSLANSCGLATNMHAITHPSLPNYIAMTSGDTQGVTNDGPPAEHPLTAQSIFGQLGTNRWRTLAESMPANCHPENSGTYAVKHNPATYYTPIAGQCATQDVPLGPQPDLSAPFTFVAPDLRSDTHDTSIGYGDNWLSGFITKVVATPEYQAGKTAVFITYDEDEDDGNAANPIPTVVVSPSTKPGTKAAAYYTHYSLLRTAEEMLNLGLLGQAAKAESMRAGFNLG